MAVTKEEQALLDRAVALRNGGKLILRTCWNCNSLHDYLKTCEELIWCFACDTWYLDGVNLTELSDKL